MSNLRLYHDEHFEFVEDENGDWFVMTSEGLQPRRRDVVAAEANYTDLVVPSDFTATPVEMANLVAMLTQRHASNVTAVSGDDAGLVAKLAALLDAEIVEA